MRYDQIMSIITESTPDEWIYDDDLGLYVYTEDVDITIISDRKWPNENGYDENSRFYEEWTEKFCDKEAYRRRFLIKYRGVTISAFYTAMVDGARCYIPYPNYENMSITQEQYGIGYIINVLPYKCEYDYYIKRAGIKVV